MFIVQYPTYVVYTLKVNLSNVHWPVPYVHMYYVVHPKSIAACRMEGVSRIQCNVLINNYWVGLRSQPKDPFGIRVGLVYIDALVSTKQLDGILAKVGSDHRGILMLKLIRGLMKGNGCGSVGTVVAYDSKCPRFEYNQRKNLY